MRAKKSLGQNFLVDQRAIQAIIDEVPRGSPFLLEIGPGRGALSVALSERVGRIGFLEKDEELLALLRETMEGADRPVFWEADALEFDYQKIWQEFGDDAQLVVAANLPYNVATEILFRLLDHSTRIPRMALMFQKEVAERIAAKHGTKKFGAISVFVQNFYETETVVRLKPESFRPRPKVDSAVVRFTRRPKPLLGLEGDDWLAFKSLVQSLFRFRRKTLENSLRFALPALSQSAAIGARMKVWNENLSNCFEAAGIVGSRRAETLSIEEWGRLFAVLGGDSGR